MVVVAMQGADQHNRSSLGFSILHKDTSTCRLGESNQWPSNNKTLALFSSYYFACLRNWLIVFCVTVLCEICCQRHDRTSWFGDVFAELWWFEWVSEERWTAGKVVILNWSFPLKKWRLESFLNYIRWWYRAAKHTFIYLKMSRIIPSSKLLVEEIRESLSISRSARRGEGNSTPPLRTDFVWGRE